MFVAVEEASHATAPNSILSHKAFTVTLCYNDVCCTAVEETSNAMALDGIMFEGVSVRVRRPNDYNPAAAAALGPSVPNPALNLGAIGLQPGGMGAQVNPKP